MGFVLHPSVPLIVWVATVVSIQFVGYPVLLILAICVLASRSVTLSGIYLFLWRARWVFCVLWFVLALNTPGEAVYGWSWMPTYEGVADANIQSARLALTLMCLSWLFSVLSGDRLLVGLCGLLMPLEKIGLKTSTLLVRLALVLENLQSPAKPGAWREMLLMPANEDMPRTDISFTMPPWQMKDSGVLCCIALIIAGSVFW